MPVSTWSACRAPFLRGVVPLATHAAQRYFLNYRTAPHRTATHRAAVDATVTAAVQYLRVGRLLRRYLCILANDMFAAKIKCIKVEDDIAVKLEEKVQSRVSRSLR